MPIFPFLPLILLRGFLDVSAEALEPRAQTPRSPPPKRDTSPAFDQSWLAASNLTRR